MLYTIQVQITEMFNLLVFQGPQQSFLDLVCQIMMHSSLPLTFLVGIYCQCKGKVRWYWSEVQKVRGDKKPSLVGLFYTASISEPIETWLSTHLHTSTHRMFQCLVDMQNGASLISWLFVIVHASMVHILFISDSETSVVDEQDL